MKYRNSSGSVFKVCKSSRGGHRVRKSSGGSFKVSKE